ncbi:hypothetical protein [Pleionea sp. CnH1-48]|uniref:hypothetical protein n=1 Tax=Pleionea sp. CnH1-48 TaxID=2954494 RepID=UPI002097B6E8|nr:hypothetical protein [Pleionea sp. CnH1-48]MCO7224107.1 hypothetical protein [Pleionea sp. CnH1-48]
MVIAKKMMIAVSALTLCACGGGSSSSNSNASGSTNPPPPTNKCSQAISEGASLGITDIPASAAAEHRNNFCKYTKLVAPNGKAIHFFAQDQITNEQMVRARNILEFYLTNVPGSQYGADKTAVWNKMADNNAILIMPNGSDTGSAPASGQTLFQTENVVEGSDAYLVNEPRDAAFEEILHLMHDTGIGVDGSNTMPGVLPEFQQEIRNATNNAVPSSIVAGGKGIWASIDLNWLSELQGENSLTQEYLASIIDTYYGLAGRSSSGGSNDLYQPQTRAEISTIDPMGWALVGGDSPRKFFSEYVTYNARVDKNYTGTFTLNFDANQKYTHKSQYLINVTLTGSSPITLIGNNQANDLTGNVADNEIIGNQGNDTINGGDGTDTATFTGNAVDYTITNNNGVVTVVDSVAGRDGTDTLTSIELLKFADTSFSP